MKIINHCKQQFPTIVTGQLLGLDFNKVLEVTNSFPFPNVTAKNKETIDGNLLNLIYLGAQYQMDMMRCHRELNIDTNTVGWYQSTHLSSFMNQTLIETQYSYQKSLGKKSVVIIHGDRILFITFRCF